MPVEHQIITISDEALARVLEVRDREPDAEELALTIAVTGESGPEFTYELAFVNVDDAAGDDAIARYGPLPVIVPAEHLDSLRGAELHVNNGSLAINNPNSPIPKIATSSAGTAGSLGEQVAAVLNQQINPAIASHGGWAELVDVEGDTVMLRLGGGCQGCGLAQMTLRHGIEAALRKAIPEIGAVVDITDHTSGENPYC